MNFKNLINVSTAVKPFCEGDGIERTNKISRGKSAQFFCLCVHDSNLCGSSQFRPNVLPVVRAQVDKTAIRVMRVYLFSENRARDAYPAGDLVDVLLVYFEPFCHLFTLLWCVVWKCHETHLSETLEHSQAFRYSGKHFFV